MECLCVWENGRDRERKKGITHIRTRKWFYVMVNCWNRTYSMRSNQTVTVSIPHYNAIAMAVLSEFLGKLLALASPYGKFIHVIVVVLLNVSGVGYLSCCISSMLKISGIMCDDVLKFLLWYSHNDLMECNDTAVLSTNWN